MVQILILAAIAAFLFWRLSIVLGIRSGFEKTADIKVHDVSKKNKSQSKVEMTVDLDEDDIADYVELSSESGQSLKKIKEVEPSFSVSQFVSGAKKAYEIILMAYEKGDLDVLETHLEDDVYKDFESVVTDRANKGYIVEDLLKDLMLHFRNLSVLNFKNGLKLAGIDSELSKKYNQLSYNWSHKDIIRLSNNLSTLYASIRQYSDQYLLLEMHLIKLLEFDSSIDIEEFLKKEISQEQQVDILKEKTVNKTLDKKSKKKEKKIDFSEELLKNDWNQIVKEVSKKRGSIGAQLSGCILGDLKDNNLDLISYDNSEFNQKLLKEGLELVKTIIDEKYGSNVNISLVVDTEVEKIENKKNDKVNEDDIISLFDGKDML